MQLERDLLTKIGQLRPTYLPPTWNIYLRYAWLRLSGHSSGVIIAGGNFLNYGVLWDDAEKVFVELSGDQALSSAAAELHSAFAATDDGRTRGDGARQPQRASLVRVDALSKRPQRPVRFSIWSLAPL